MKPRKYNTGHRCAAHILLASFLLQSCYNLSVPNCNCILEEMVQENQTLHLESPEQAIDSLLEGIKGAEESASQGKLLTMDNVPDLQASALLYLGACEIKNNKYQKTCKIRRKSQEKPEENRDLKELYLQLLASQPINCQKFDLRNIDLSKLNLQGADFSNANLKGVDFSRSNLRGAKFVNAQLQKVNFSYADLTEADLTQAKANGAKFKGAHLHHMKYADVLSAKGTILENKQDLSKKLEEEEKINLIEIEKKFFANEPEYLLPLEGLSSIKDIYDFLYSKLTELLENEEVYIVADFRPLFLNSSGSAGGQYFFQECLHFLRSPFFRPLVKKAVSIDENRAIVVFLNIQEKPIKEKKEIIISLDKKKLDLHGKIALSKKYNWIDKFIEKSYSHNLATVEIITGRGLHNPDGKMGVLWHLCRSYLLSSKFKGYIQGIYSISHNGGWKVILKTSYK